MFIPQYAQNTLLVIGEFDTHEQFVIVDVLGEKFLELGQFVEWYTGIIRHIGDILLDRVETMVLDNSCNILFILTCHGDFELFQKTPYLPVCKDTFMSEKKYFLSFKGFKQLIECLFFIHHDLV